jgi:hypothetical protein
MKIKTSLIMLAMIFLVAIAWAQTTTTSATYTAGSANVIWQGGNEPTNTTYSSAMISLSIPLPAVKIRSVDVSYTMTSTPGYVCDDQRSYVVCKNPGGLPESTVARGTETPGVSTISYNRTGLTIANGVVSSGSVVFELHTFMMEDENTTTVDNNSFTVTIHHDTIPMPTSLVAGLYSSTSLKVSWQSSNPALLVYNSSNSFVEPTDGVAYTTGSNLGTATVLYSGSLNEFIHTGLDSLTTYYYKIWAYSATNIYTHGASATGITANPVSLPIEEGFEGTTFPPPGWSKTSGTGVNWLRTVNTERPNYVVSIAPNNNINGTIKKMLSTPALIFPKTRYRLSFWVNRSSTTTVLGTYLEVVLNPAKQLTGGTVIATISNSANVEPVEAAGPGWYQYSYDITMNPNDVRYVNFIANLPFRKGGIMIDDVRIEQVADFPQGDNTVLAGVGINPSEDLNLDDSIDETSPIIADLPSFAHLGDMRVIGLSGTGNSVNIDVTAPSGSWYGSIYYGGSWHQSEPVFIDESDVSRIFTFTGVDFTAKDGEVIILLSESDTSTLPLELSVFNAVLTSQNYVNLTWISESETGMVGYRVYRSETDEQANALMITPNMIFATNTSTTATYSYIDNELSYGSTYYYWLEAVEHGSSNFYGPQSVTVNSDNSPELILHNYMKAAYPNPFKANGNTNIEVNIKAGESGVVSIYNVIGQLVYSYKVSEGNHKLVWNGRDSQNKPCGSGIYFYKLSTPSLNQAKKLVIVK